MRERPPRSPLPLEQLPEIPEAAAPGLYVHVPFCSRICPYCDFAVTPLGRSGPGRLERYRQALLREIELRASPLGADTVYFGGGTPSVAPPGFFREAVAAAVEKGLAGPSSFVVLEANPEDLARDPQLARQWVNEGVSGVSLGAQALDDSRLRFLGRVHTARDVEVAVGRLADAGMSWISFDFIYGTAGQTPASLRAELAGAASLPGVRHLSSYELTLEPETPFGRRAAAGEPLGVPPDEGSALFHAVHETLGAHGFPAYEASSFAAAPEYRSRHNRKYWTGVEYLGIGPSAHSFAPARSERFWNHRNFEGWEAAVLRGETPVAGREVLNPGQRALEKIFLGLRTVDGLDLAAFSSLYGEEPLRANRTRFREWERRGLVRLEGDFGSGRLRPTLAGLGLADALAREVDLDSLFRDRNAA